MNQPHQVKHHPAEPLTLEIFADAPYEYICPDGEMSELAEVDQQLSLLYIALRLALKATSEESDAVLGSAVRQVAEHRGVYWDGEKLMLKERYS